MEPAILYRIDDFKRRATRAELKRKSPKVLKWGKVWLTVNQIHALLEKHRLAVKQALKWTWDNDIAIIVDSRGRPALKVSVSPGCISLWTIAGFALGHWDHVPDDLEEMADQAGQGQFRCDECKQWFPLTQVKSYGFAGGVCGRCYDPNKHCQPSTVGDG